MNTSDTHTAEDNQAKLTQNENLSGNLPEQTEPSACDIQNHAEIEKLLGTDELAYGYRCCCFCVIIHISRAV